MGPRSGASPSASRLLAGAEVCGEAGLEVCRAVALPDLSRSSLHKLEREET